MIEGIQKGAVLADQCDLGGGGTGIDSEETVSFVSGKVFFHNLCLRVTLTEGVKLCLVLEQRIQSLDLKCNLDLLCSRSIISCADTAFSRLERSAEPEAANR